MCTYSFPFPLASTLRPCPNEAWYGLGASNIFISIYESNSVDRTPLLLHELEETLNKMGVKTRFIVSSQESHDDKEHRRSEQDQERRRAVTPTRPKFSPNSHERIAYMADLRNEAMKPLFELVHEEEEDAHDDEHDAVGEEHKDHGLGKRGEWAKVVWINDVFWDWRASLFFVPSFFILLRKDTRTRAPFPRPFIPTLLE